MKEDPWTCDKCGSTEVSQEWGVLLPMNKENGWEEGIASSFANDFYYCTDCDEECSPVRASVNSLVSNDHEQTT